MKTQTIEWKWRNLHCWHKFYTAAGSDGSDKSHLWRPEVGAPRLKQDRVDGQVVARARDQLALRVSGLEEHVREVGGQADQRLRVSHSLCLWDDCQVSLCLHITRQSLTSNDLTLKDFRNNRFFVSRIKCDKDDNFIKKPNHQISYQPSRTSDDSKRRVAIRVSPAVVFHMRLRFMQIDKCNSAWNCIEKST